MLGVQVLNLSVFYYFLMTTEGLQILMGLLLLLGVTKLRNLSLSEIWEKGGLGIDFIQSVVSQKRF
jgi:hypothetical protein